MARPAAWRTPGSGGPRATAPGRVVRHLSGFEFIHARLSARDWRRTFSVNVFVYVRDGGRRMDFHIDGTGAVWRGVTSSTKTVKLGPDELYGLVRCIDGCTKILRDPFGAPTVGATESGAQVTLPPGADAFRCARGEAGTEMRGAA